jgi:hypothetical protein
MEKQHKSVSDTTGIPTYVLDGRRFAQATPAWQLSKLIEASRVEKRNLLIVDCGQDLLARLRKMTPQGLREARRAAGAPIRAYNKKSMPEPTPEPVDNSAIAMAFLHYFTPQELLDLAMCREAELIAAQSASRTSNGGTPHNGNGAAVHS